MPAVVIVPPPPRLSLSFSLSFSLFFYCLGKERAVEEDGDEEEGDWEGKGKEKKGVRLISEKKNGRNVRRIGKRKERKARGVEKKNHGNRQ